MIKFQKGFIHLFLLVIIVLIGIGGLLYYFWQGGLIKRSATETPTNVTDKIEGWETYTNDIYRITFMYPKGWEVENINTTGSKYLVRINFSSPDLEVESGYMGGDWPTNIYKKGGSFYLSVSESEHYKSFEELKKAESTDKSKVIILDETQALYTPRDLYSTQFSIETLFLKNADSNSNPILFQIGIVSSPKDRQQYTVLLDQILSTFKFSERGEYVVREISHGGLCPDGECMSTRSIDSKGNVYLDRGKVGNIDSKELTNLINLIDNTDFQKVKSKKYTGTCPTAYDGQEVVYYFSTVNGEEKIASCETEIDFTSSPFIDISNIFVKFFIE